MADAFNVFIVDDDDGVREAVVSLFEAYGYSAQPFASVASFLDAYAPVDRGCILLDLHMPGLSGLTWLRSRNETSPIHPVVVVSGSVNKQIRKELLDLGAFAVLEKPVSGERLIDVVSQAMGVSETSEREPHTAESMTGRGNGAGVPGPS